MEKVLKIRNPPTSSATTAKISMKVLKKDIALRNWSWVSAMTACPVIASVPLGSTVCSRLTISDCDTPDAATTEMSSYLPGSPTSFWATATGKATTDAPPGLSATPKVTMPAIRNCCGGPEVSTVAMSPYREARRRGHSCGRSRSRCRTSERFPTPG